MLIGQHVEDVNVIVIIHKNQVVDRIDVFQWSYRFVVDIDVLNEIIYFERRLRYLISGLITIITKWNIDVNNMYYGM